MRKETRCKVKAVLLLLLACLIPAGLFGQMTARGLGMGCAYTALARGYHAQAWNPANLGLPDNPKFSMTFISLLAGVWNNSFTQKMYDQYLVNGTKDADGDIIWDQQDIQDILNHIPDDGLGLAVSAYARAFSFSVGRFALSIGADVGSFVQIDKSVLDLALRGNRSGETYSLEKTDGKALGVGLVSFSWGQPIQVPFADVFAVGATVSLLYGGAYGNVDKADFSLTMAEYWFNVDGDYEVTYGMGGLGWGVDLGAATQLDDNWVQLT